MSFTSFILRDIISQVAAMDERALRIFYLSLGSILSSSPCTCYFSKFLILSSRILFSYFSNLSSSYFFNNSADESVEVGMLIAPFPVLPSIAFKRYIYWAYSFSRASLGSSLIIGLFFINLALEAYRRVLRVSSKL